MKLAPIGVGLALLIALRSPAVAAAPATWEQYFSVKTVLQQLYDVDSQGEGARGNTYDLMNCNRGSDYLGHPSKNGVLPAFANIALDVVIWREGLDRSGYPADLWRPALKDFEQREVDAAIAAAGRSADVETMGIDFRDSAHMDFYKRIKEPLGAYRASHPAAPKIITQGSCGDADVRVNIATEPRGAQVLFIPTFFYKLCKVQKQNPDDPNACPNWREALDSKLSYVSGDYVYLVHWNDGTVRRGKLNFGVNDDGRTITLRKP